MRTLQYVGLKIAEIFSRPPSEGWVFARVGRELGLFPKGRAGRGGAGAPIADTPHAILLALAMAEGRGVRDSLMRASATCDLPFLDAGRNYCVPDGMISLPFHTLPEELPSYSFGQIVGSLINTYRVGVRPEDLQHDEYMRVHGIRYGFAEGSPFATIERRSIVPNAEGQTLIDLFIYRPPRNPLEDASIESSTFIPARVLERIARILGPLSVSGSGGGKVRLSMPSLVDEDQEEQAEIGIAAEDGNERPAAEKVN